MLRATAARIGTSKIGPRLRCFVHFDLEMCFAPAALASLLFEHPEPRIVEKTERFATFLTFGACVCLLSSNSTRVLVFFLVTLLAC